MYDPIEAAARGIKMAIRANLMTLAAMFREIDGDSSGCVSLAEFDRALRLMGLQHTCASPRCGRTPDDRRSAPGRLAPHSPAAWRGGAVAMRSRRSSLIWASATASWSAARAGYNPLPLAPPPFTRPLTPPL